MLGQISISVFGAMTTPLPMRLIDRLIAGTHFPVLIVGSAISLPLISIFILSGAIYPADVSPWSANPLEMTGLFLMFSIMPAYLMMCLVASRPLMDSNFKFIYANIDQPELLDQLRARWSPWWPLALVFGVINVFLNIGTINLTPGQPQFAVSACIVLGQFMMWNAIGIILFFGLHEAFILHMTGKEVRFSLYELDKLNGFGRIALNSFLMIAGALALSTLQSLDQEFRWINYRNGILIGVPAALILVPLPIWNLHRRIVAAKAELIEEINQHIAQTSKSLEGENLVALNNFLVRREQVQNLRNWPMNLSIATRFLAYAFIVPLAWSGAAIVEFVLDSILSG